jgi:type IV secretory pathway TrbD component
LSQSAERRANKVFKAMNRPLTVLGAERRLFFVALISGGSIFSLLHSLLGGIGLFIVGVIVARIATKHDVEILRVLFNSSKFRRRYDPMKDDETQIRITRRHAQG